MPMIGRSPSWGACRRGLYDNRKTAVESVFVGKGRVYNRRLLQMCARSPPARLRPAEKGQVENQVRLVRECFFTPRLRFKCYGKLNGWLLDKCVSYARLTATRGPGPDGLVHVRGRVPQARAIRRALR